MNHQNPERSEIEKRNRKHHEIPKPKIGVRERESTLGARWFNGSSTDFECLTVNGSRTQFRWLSLNGRTTFGTASLTEFERVWESELILKFSQWGEEFERVWESLRERCLRLRDFERVSVDCFKWEGKKALKRKRVYKTRFPKSSFINSLSKWKLSPCQQLKNNKNES